MNAADAAYPAKATEATAVAVFRKPASSPVGATGVPSQQEIATILQQLSGKWCFGHYTKITPFRFDLQKRDEGIGSGRLLGGEGDRAGTPVVVGSYRDLVTLLAMSLGLDPRQTPPSDLETSLRDFLKPAVLTPGRKPGVPSERQDIATILQRLSGQSYFSHHTKITPFRFEYQRSGIGTLLGQADQASTEVVVGSYRDLVFLLTMSLGFDPRQTPPSDLEKRLRSFLK